MALHWLALGTALMLLPGCHSQMTDAEKQEALNFANFLRRSVVPRAGDMNALFWSDTLAGLAQDAANACVFQHNYGGAYARLGENVYHGGKRNMTEIFMFMYLERENYDFKTGACNINSASKYTMFTTCGHYLQLVTANIMHMGCGLKLCSDGYYLAFCEFSKGYNSPPYQAGEPGTMCHNSFASYTQNGMCYYKPPLGPSPVNGTLDCNLSCYNYGNVTQYLCMCTCPLNFYGIRCEELSGTRTVPNDCKAQLVTCKNGGTPTLTNEVCKCVCPDNYRGDACEENIPQMDNSIFWYFGQQMHYQSYYPVDPNIWTTKYIESTVVYYLTTELNAFCKANYQSCCPNSPSATADANFVAYTDFQVTDGYPTNVLDGSLKVGTCYRMPDSVAKACGGPSAPYVNRNAVLAAAAKAMTSVKSFLVYFGVSAIKYE